MYNFEISKRVALKAHTEEWNTVKSELLKTATGVKISRSQNVTALMKSVMVL
jgi:hypothetical protein